MGMGLYHCDQRHFAYYRFHKRIGKGNWNRYIERYTKPRAIENTQNLIFNYRASFQAAKNSASYLWELPKRIASATSANEVFDAWICFRHKRKKCYHYILALKRLCEIKDVDTSDWRFQLIAKKLLKRSKYFIGKKKSLMMAKCVDLPNVCRYLGLLKAVPTLDKLSIQLCENVERYSPHQLALIATAFGNCRLHSKHLFSLLSKQLGATIHHASNKDLTTIADAFGKCMVYNYGTLASISLEMQKRLTSEFQDATLHTALFTTPIRHCMVNIQNPVVVHVTKPTMHDILDLVEAFSRAKYRDVTLCDLLSQMVRSELARCDHRNVINPEIISRVLRTFISLKVNDIPLFLSILTDAAARPYNYPPSCLSEIGAQLSTVLPRHLDSVANVSLLHCIYNDLQMFYVCLNELKCHIHRMDPSQVGWKYAASQKVQLTSTAIFAHKACSSVSQKCDFFRQICESLVNQRSHVLKYDAPKLMEVMSMHNSLTEDSFHIICRDIYRVISCFEPVDYQRTARVLRRLKRSNLTNLKMVNMLSKHVLNHRDEFSDFQYHCVARDLTLAGPPQESLLLDLWSRNR
ncbi:hypothetical protein X943_003749 [Babesia divergens]|uniref:RAP domain-containing protein n=1 Tax=Babesia divergens TaxID=32595 RepID=A0AAD9GHY5_BABDI|nr:hypothetical protein X943_003749 [Babesia divergens]